jgi:protoporphyrinogen oxidase
MGTLPAQLAQGLPADAVRLNTPVQRVGPGEVVVDGHRIRADRVVVAVEGPSAVRLLGLAPVRSNPASCVWFGAPAAPVEHKYLVLNGSGNGPALNVAVMSNVAPDYAPAGAAVIAAACPGIDDASIEPTVRQQLRDMWGSQVDSWVHLRTDAIAHGQPRQHPPFSPKKSIVVGDGLFVCGDHRDTASIQGALFSGRRCGEAVVASLT